MDSLFDPYGGYSNLSLIEKSLSASGYSLSNAKEFYSWVFCLDPEEFPDCPIQVSDKSQESFNHKPNPIGYCRTAKSDPHGRFRVLFRDTFFDDLKILQDSEFSILNCITYFGRRNLSENAGKMHALIFDIDDVTPTSVAAFLGGIRYDVYPAPSAIVLSGGGMHLYYIFEQPINLYPETKIYVKALKYALTKVMWNKYTSKDENVQQQGINQGFRVPGGKTEKYGDYRLKVYISSNRKDWTIDDLSSFVTDKNQLPQDSIARYKESKFTLEEAKSLYPDWYRKVILKQPIVDEKGNEVFDGDPETDGLGIKFFYNRAVYDWWKNKVEKEAFVGNRYKCVMFLAVFAMKCHYHKVRLKKKYREYDPADVVVKRNFETRYEGVTEEEFKKDVKELQERFNVLGGKIYPFTDADVNAALEAYDSKYVTYPRKSIQNFSGLFLTPHSRRNNRHLTAEQIESGESVQKLHLKLARYTRDIMHPNNSWGYKPKSFRKDVEDWVLHNPGKEIKDCINALNLSRSTVAKYWPTEQGKQKRKAYHSPKYKDNVIAFRKKYPKDTISDCVRKTGLSRSTVKRYWNLSDN